jgi:NADPH:quinone reductase-like Zn-dependent oxidoreductase
LELPKAHLTALKWKHAKWLSPADAVLGCDFAGTIAALGSSVDASKYKVGDRVAGFVVGGRTVGIGSYAEYLQV